MTASKLLLDSIRDHAIIMLDLDGNVASWNRGAEELEGYRADEIIGQHVSRLRPEDERDDGRSERELAQARTEGRFEEEAWRVRKDGTRFWASVVLSPLRDGTGELLGFVKVTRDLTERRKLEQERLALSQAEEAARLRDQFLSIASHELKTPLSTLLLQLDAAVAQLGDREPAIRARVERATRSAERLDQLIDTLLDVSRITTGRLALHTTTFAIGDAVADVVEQMGEAAVTAGCAVTLAVSGGPLVGTWDRLRVEQLVANLLANAFKYAPGTAIDLTVGHEGDQAVLTVRDRGPGIAPSEIDRVFGRFERGVSMRHFGGMGLGLYVVQQIAVAHGGSASATTATGGGAILTVRLPLGATP